MCSFFDWFCHCFEQVRSKSWSVLNLYGWENPKIGWDHLLLIICQSDTKTGLTGQTCIIQKGQMQNKNNDIWLLVQSVDHPTQINIQISLTPGQVATDVCQALEYSTWKAHVHINQRIPTPVSKELLSEDILRMAHTVHSVPLSIFRAQGPPDSLLSSCDPPFWCHGFLCHGDIQIQFCNICRNHTSFSVLIL